MKGWQSAGITDFYGRKAFSLAQEVHDVEIRLNQSLCIKMWKSINFITK